MRYLFTFLMAFAAFPGVALGKPVISELMWMGSDLSTADEWIELADSEGLAADLSGYTVHYLDGETEKLTVTFPAGTTLAAGKFFLVSNYDEPNSRLASIPDFVTTTVTLPNTKLLLRLRDPSGVLVDEVDDGVGAPFAGVNASGTGTRASMERISLSLPGTDPANWRSATVGNGFDAGFPLLGTPGFENGAGDSSSSSSTPSSSPSSSSVSSVSSESSFSSVFSDSSESSEESSSSSLSSISSISSDSSASSDPSESSSIASSNSSSQSSIRVEPYGKLKITEVLPNPRGEDTEEWIEVGNLGSESVNIAGLILDDGNSATFYTIPPRSSGGFLLGAREHVSFRKSVSKLALDNGGERISLSSGSLVIDAWAYPNLPEEVSYGRDPIDPEVLRPFCVATEGKPNDVLEIDPQIVIQSGDLQGEESVSLNLDTTVTRGSLVSLQCRYDFGDGTSTEQCNPPSHKFTSVGTFQVSLRVVSYCGTTVERSLTVTVSPKSSSRSSSSSPTTSSTGGNGGAVVRSSSSPPASLFTPQEQGEVLLTGALPNPEGRDEGSEWVEFTNVGSSHAELEGWKIDTGEGTPAFVIPRFGLEPRSTERFSLKASKISLRNTEGQVRLRRPSGLVASSLSWKKASDGKIIRAEPPERHLSAKVIRVIDGDTLEVEFASPPVWLGNRKTVRVRLIGIDTPELTGPVAAVTDASLYVKNFLRDLLEGNNIELEFDSEVTDVYDRLLAYVSIDGALLQEKILREGMAAVYKKFPFTRMEEFIGFEAEAKKAKKGIWALGAKTGSASSSSASDGEHSSSSRPAKPRQWPRIQISEVFPSPDPSSPASGLGEEWIELHNPGSDAVSLSGWKLDDIEKKGSKPWSFPVSFEIAPGGYAIFLSSSTRLQLTNDGDEVTLLSPDGQVIDHVQYGKVKKSFSYARMESSETFCLTKQATPGTRNSCATLVAMAGGSPLDLSQKKGLGGNSRAKTISGKIRNVYKNIVQDDQSLMSSTASENPLLAKLESMESSVPLGDEVSEEGGISWVEWFVIALLVAMSGLALKFRGL